ncbi:hypothetical protein A3I48_04330 [Candidatus Daviesbacteria bacterium RIFCSPLOWO2_02_FULL_36_7]|uniref:Damage-inducible protein J n=1 Tax=Candidatus Daviesbacteria bacterium RIFCSPLOWO2_02_FULL_36_7 TaxID=1797792 RepID=A0A1F5MI68_9BACT|nr:MAG: hypothetical protein A3I48_04330 [Candidatus Daviesbacteria bacterium RIFCSPLOWO2_02_FULL_36_7]
MQTAAIYIKTDPKVKAQAQKVAKELGLSLSSLLNSWLRHVIKTKTVTFSAVNEKPSKYLLKMLKKAEKDRKQGKSSPKFENAEDAIAWLHR